MAELADSLISTTFDRLDQAEGLVRSYCGWHIAPSRLDTATFASDWSLKLLLPSMFVTAIASVAVDGTVLDSDSYGFTSNGVLTLRGWGYWPGETVVSFTHGYTVPPPEVTGVVQAVGQRAVSNPGSATRMQAGPFLMSPSLTGAGQAVPLALLDSEKSILDAYRIPERP